MKKRGIGSILISVILLVCMMFCACSTESCNIWYDYNFGPLPKFNYVKVKQSGKEVRALRYNGNIYVALSDCDILVPFKTEDYAKIGYIQGSFIGSIIMGSYILYVHTEDLSKDFIIQCRNRSKMPMENYATKEIIESFYDMPIRSIGGVDVAESVSVNDLKDDKVQINNLVQSLSASLYLADNYSFIDDAVIYSSIYFQDGLLYLKVFDVQTYDYIFFTIKSQYYYLFSPFIKTE